MKQNNEKKCNQLFQRDGHIARPGDHNTRIQNGYNMQQGATKRTKNKNQKNHRLRTVSCKLTRD